jgi:hypothetical protein
MIRIALALLLAGQTVQGDRLPASDPGATELGAYQLLRGSTYSEGCVSPCTCPIAAYHLGGTFLLRQEREGKRVDTYSLRRIQWQATAGGEVVHEITGRGVYRVATADRLYHRLDLELQVDGGGVQYLQSGVVPGGAAFPRISIESSRGTECFDVWIDLDATPVLR